MFLSKSVIVTGLLLFSQTCESVGDFLCDNEDVHTSPHKKRNGRKITKMDDVFARTPNMPKIRITVNEHGQPVGPNSRQLSSVIGCLVRKKLSVRCYDWRLIDIEEKDAVWDELQKFYDISDAAKTWFLKSAAQKWKDFKADLKEQYLDDKLTDEELKKRHGDRVNDEDWNFLVNYWKSPESEIRTQIAKANRAKLEIHHTSGTKSFACSAHEMVDELGRPPRRDELYVKTHTRKNGVAIGNAAPIISKLKETVEAHPELTEKTIQEGDVFAIALGSKEPRGCVRALGLGPTPQDVGIAGLKSYTPTRFQIEVLARKKAEYFLVNRPTAAATMQSPSNVAPVMQPHAAPSSQCSPTNASPAVPPHVVSQVQSRQCSLNNAAPTMQPHASQQSQLQVA